MARGSIYPAPAPAGGGGGGFAPVTITGTTGEIANSSAADLDIALPAGITRYEIVGARVTRTAGAASTCSVAVYQTDARSDTAVYVFGDSFSGVDMPGPVKGPVTPAPGGAVSRAPISIQSESEFARLTIANPDFDDPGTFAVELDILPLGA